LKFAFYEEQPASPVIEWYRYANRRSKDFQRWGPRIVEHAVLALTIFAVGIALGRPDANNEAIWLTIGVCASLVLVPVLKWVFYFVTAFHALLKEENAKLAEDLVASQATVKVFGSKQRNDSAESIAERTARIYRQNMIDKLAPPPDVRETIERFPHVVVKQETAMALATLWTNAVHQLLNRKVVDDGQFAMLKRDIEQWESEVLKVLERHATVEEIMTFRVLGTYTSRATGGFSAEHNRELAMLHERLNRLQRIIQRLSPPK
jgi:hypothetical protein